MTKSIVKTIAAGATAAVFALGAASTAIAADQSEFTVKRTTNGFVKASVKAYKTGDYERAAKLNERALKDGLSNSRKAVAQSNLCASYAMLGEVEKAQAACEAAMILRPDLAEAKSNTEALRIKLVQNK